MVGDGGVVGAQPYEALEELVTGVRRSAVQRALRASSLESGQPRVAQNSVPDSR